MRGYRALSVPDHAKDGLALLDHLGIERAHVLGWSMGVQVGLELALTAPERVLSLSLMGGAAATPTARSAAPASRARWASNVWCRCCCGACRGRMAS
jgi:pimeloyl-ACP methyl ester carboxylesterase